MFGKYTAQEFLKTAEAFHGHAAPGVLLGAFLVEAARAKLPEGCIFDVVSESRQCLPDAVQLLTPCTFGNGWLRVMDLGLYAVCLYDKQTGEGWRAAVDPEKLKCFPLTREWFLKLTKKKDQDGDALRQEIMDHGAEMVSVRKIQMHPEELAPRHKGAIAICPVCGEAYPASHGDTCLLCAKGRGYDML